ncbi:MAG: cytidine deaminase [Clostridia bacterium]|nr:cytidine deaminase [Clostridia bacterium]
MYTWQELYDMAKERLNPRVLTPFMDAGGVAAAILTDKGNVYVGVCIDTCCSLGMCAERNAVANMITNGESRIVKLVCVMGDGRVGSPCGACREMMMQLERHSPEIEILTDLETLSTVTLGDLVPDWWGTERMTQQ